MDLEFIKQVIPLYVEASVLSLFFGVLFALIRFWKLPILNLAVIVYTEISRNTPLLIQLFFLYFALPRIGIRLTGEQCALIGVVFLGSSYMTETFRSALETVSKSQVESGLCIGLHTIQIARYVVFPQGLSVAIPGVVANIIFLLKETSVFSAVALADVMFIAKDLIGLYYKTEESLFLLVVAYFIMLLPITVISRVLEKRLSQYRGKK